MSSRIRNEAILAHQIMSRHAGLTGEIETRLLPGAIRQVEDTEIAYRNGLIDLQAALRARDQQLNLRAARLDALRDFHLARVRYETALGKTQ